ncbi:hypothetical protein [Herbidospora cretacea]|uniref:hypothetical protein n=1 Tax=Herbidospora cretacea TaxID=28444 RepID=UPI0018CC4805|nr:hypothetical protein [Herbidospora cretacea]
MTPAPGEAAARQLDAVLLSVGFACSTALLDHLGRLPAGDALDLGVHRHTYADLLAAHAELVPLAADRVTVLDLGGTLAAARTPAP